MSGTKNASARTSLKCHIDGPDAAVVTLARFGMTKKTANCLGLRRQNGITISPLRQEVQYFSPKPLEKMLFLDY
jgi:hypothetical protein